MFKRQLLTTLLISCLAAVFCAAPVWAGGKVAQTDSSSAKAKTAAKESPHKKTSAMGDVTVTATKTELDPDTVPFTMHTVDRDDIEDQPSPFMNNLGEFIRDVPGVHVAQYYPWGPPWIHLRGTGYFIGRTIY